MSAARAIGANRDTSFPGHHPILTAYSIRISYTSQEQEKKYKRIMSYKKDWSDLSDMTH